MRYPVSNSDLHSGLFLQPKLSVHRAFFSPPPFFRLPRFFFNLLGELRTGFLIGFLTIPYFWPRFQSALPKIFFKKILVQLVRDLARARPPPFLALWLARFFASRPRGPAPHKKNVCLGLQPQSLPSSSLLAIFNSLSLFCFCSYFPSPSFVIPPRHVPGGRDILFFRKGTAAGAPFSCFKFTYFLLFP